MPPQSYPSINNKNRRRTMKTKNIFKALALAMLMPATMLTTACSSDDSIINDENTATKGFELPVTVNVTREGDKATTRATYTDNGDGTGTLGFSTGDKLLVKGMDNGFEQFAGILTWQSGGTFSGTITTENTSYTGTADDLFKNASMLQAYLLPAGYDSKGFIIVTGSGYDMGISYDWTKAFALTKAEAVEQLSREYAGSYSSGTGFALAPLGFILNFTITGLTPSTEVAVAFTKGPTTISGNVTTDGSGNATFAIGTNSANIGSCTLTVGGNNIALPSTSLKAGKIYNITRSAAPAATSLSELKTAINGGTDCSSYIGWEVNSAGAIAASSVSGTKIGYVAYVSTSDVDAGVSGSRILVIASADAAATTLTWGSFGTARGVEAVEDANDLNGYSNTNTLQDFGESAHPAAYAAWNYSATIPSGGATPAHWFMPTKKQWENMRDAKGGTYNAMKTAYGIDGHYWTSTEVNNNNAWRFVTNNNIQSNMKSLDFNVRSIFAY